MFRERTGPDPKPEKQPKAKYKKIRKVSKKMSRRQEVYKIARKAYLEDHPICERCQEAVATTIHHQKGRIGDLLTNMRYFFAACMPCHQWIERHPSESIQLGYSKYRNK